MRYLILAFMICIGVHGCNQINILRQDFAFSLCGFVNCGYCKKNYPQGYVLGDRCQQCGRIIWGGYKYR